MHFLHVQVARHLFHNCLRQYLVQKQGVCVVLVTHQLQVRFWCFDCISPPNTPPAPLPKFVADADRVLVLGENGQQIAFGAPGHPEGVFEGDTCQSLKRK